MIYLGGGYGGAAMKRVLAFILAILMMLSLVGCLAYSTSHTELHVVALHSLPGVSGHPGEEVMILEEDDFGRVMFAYVGRTAASDIRDVTINILAVLIAQRTTRRYSYFYDGINFIVHEVRVSDDLWPRDFFTEGFVMKYFTGEQLEQLKEENSWNRELNEDSFFRVRVSRRGKRNFMTDVSVETQREAFESVSSEFFPFGGGVPLTTDRNGNVIYFLRPWGGRAFLFMFDGNGDFIEGAVMEMHDLWDYRDQLREFKKLNGWAFAYR